MNTNVLAISSCRSKIAKSNSSCQSKMRMTHRRALVGKFAAVSLSTNIFAMDSRRKAGFIH